MLHLILSLLYIALLIALERLLLLDGILHLFHFCIEFANYVFFLLFLKLLRLRHNWIDNLLNLSISMINNICLDMFLTTICIDFIISNAMEFLGRHSYLKVILKFINFPSILLLAPNKSILTAPNVILNFIVLIRDLLRFFNNLRKAFIPITRLCIFVRFFSFQVNFFY